MDATPSGSLGAGYSGVSRGYSRGVRRGFCCTLQAILHSDIAIPHLWRFIHLLSALAENSFASLAKVTRISNPRKPFGEKINLRL